MKGQTMLNHKSFKVLFLLLANVSILGCLALGITTKTAATQTPIAAQTTPGSELTDEEIMSGIQTSLDIIVQAYEQNDVELLSHALDLDNKAFSRFVKTRFQSQQESFSGNGIKLSYRVESITRREYGLALAHIDYDNSAAVDWIFRQLDDGRWALTEPTVKQTGEMVVHETDFFEFRTYPWADDVNSQVEQLMQNARDRVRAVLGKVPDEKIEVEIIPTYGLYPFDNPNALAYYQYEGAFDHKGDRMVIYAPNSFLFGWYLKDVGWKKDLEDTLTHEYTHMTHARSFGYVGRLSDWIVEGLAEYVDGINRAGTLAEAYNSDALIPLVDTREGVVYKQDLAHINLLDKDISLAYAEAESLVAFIVEKKGGLDAFWSFAQAYTDDGGNLDQALKKSMGISQNEFEKEWKTWLADEYFPKYLK